MYSNAVVALSSFFLKHLKKNVNKCDPAGDTWESDLDQLLYMGGLLQPHHAHPLLPGTGAHTETTDW
jgi:hypothetical protein